MSGVVTFVGLVVFVVAIGALLVLTCSRRVGPLQALVIYGIGGTRVVRAGSVVVWPVVQKAVLVPLKPFSVEGWVPDEASARTPPIPTADGRGVRVKVLVRARVGSEPTSILQAVEFLSAPPERQQTELWQAVAEHVARFVAGAPVAELSTEPAAAAARVRDGLEAELIDRLGLAIDDVTLGEVAIDDEKRIDDAVPHR
jgi:flotillin